MIKGILRGKERIVGECQLKDVVISYNNTKTVVCNGYQALTSDKIIIECNTCKKEFLQSKRFFIHSNNYERCLCKRCNNENTCISKYGVSSTNQLGSVKSKQQKNGKFYEDGINVCKKKTSSKEELCKLRSENTKKKWKRGDYNSKEYREKLSASQKLLWSDDEYKKRMFDISDNESVRKKKSESSKKRWLDLTYRENMCKFLREYCNRDEVRKKRSDLMKDRWDSGKNNIDFLKNLPKRFSKLHVRIKKLLNLENIGFISERVLDRYVVDEVHYEKKIIIEINGDYVHANPKVYKSGSIIRLPGSTYTSDDKWEQDKIKLERLKSLGYTVFVIWESDDLKEVEIKLKVLYERSSSCYYSR